MRSAISLRDDFDDEGLRRLARQTKNAAQARRLLALASIYDGGSRSDAARLGHVTLQIVRDWVMRFNERGPEGLINSMARHPVIRRGWRKLERQPWRIMSIGRREWTNGF